MREAFGDIWELAAAGNRVVCVTTNLQTNSQGRAVMGGGIAKEARDKFGGIDRAYGRELIRGIDGVCHMGHWVDEYGLAFELIMFPTKDHWKFNSKLELIERSAHQLVALADQLELEEVHLPRPGCGLGGRKWEDISKLVGPILDDRFIVVGFAREAP